MKKKLLLTIIATLMVTYGAFAQNKLVATLKHGDSSKFFYGGTALQQAHDVAEVGDVITLSEGVFLETTISKAVTIRGAGMIRNAEKGLETTTIKNLILDDNGNNIKLENINFESVKVKEDSNVGNIEFRKCKLANGFSSSGQGPFIFVNCRILNQCVATGNSVIDVQNCYVWNPLTDVSTTAITVRNSTVMGREFLYHNIYYTSFYDCLIYFMLGAFPNTSTCINNVAIPVNNNYHPFENITENNTNITLPPDSYEQVFKTFRSLYEREYYDDETYEVTDDFKNTYKCEDGTEIGMYGGMIPYNTPLSFPHATSVNIAKKAEDGKLSVNIELNGGN